MAIMEEHIPMKQSRTSNNDSTTYYLSYLVSLYTHNSDKTENIQKNRHLKENSKNNDAGF